MRIELRTAQHFIHALDHPIRHHVFHLFRVVVHLVPAHAHHLHEEQLDEAMTAKHAGREFFAGAGQADAVVRLVGHQA